VENLLKYGILKMENIRKKRNYKLKKKLLLATPCIKNFYIWFKLKLVAFLQTSEFPLEIPRSQNRNFPYKTTLGNIKKNRN
jgi:hypothetical protein